MEKEEKVDRRRGGKTILTLLPSERPKLYTKNCILSAIGLRSGQGWTRAAEDRTRWIVVVALLHCCFASTVNI